MLTNIELLEFIAQEKKSTFISTGMSTMDEIRNAVKIFRKYDCPFELMHANSSYPMKNEEANLNCIATLKNEFSCKVGYSGHEPGASLVCVVSVLLGATSIERHITIDRSMYGSDHAASLEPPGLQRLVRDIRLLDIIKGDGIKHVWPSELPKLKRLRYMQWIFFIVGSTKCGTTNILYHLNEHPYVFMSDLNEPSLNQFILEMCSLAKSFSLEEFFSRNDFIFASDISASTNLPP